MTSARFAMAARTATVDTLVLGIGNTLLADDGVGVRIVECLRGDPQMASLVLIDGGTISFALLSYMETALALLAIDAAELAAPAGTVKLFEADAMDRFIRRSGGRSVHEIGLADLLDMARLHGCLPQRRALVCVQPERIDWGEQLTPSVQAAIPYACQQISHVLKRWAS